MNYYPFHIGDYLSATRHLSWEEDAAYRRLLDTYYITEKPLPAEIRAVCRLVLAATDSQREAVRVVLEEFFELTEYGWVNRRADAEITAMLDKQQKQREKANKRWQKHAQEPGNTPGIPQHQGDDATASKNDADAMPPTPTPTPTPSSSLRSEEGESDAAAPPLAQATPAAETKKAKVEKSTAAKPDDVTDQTWADWLALRKAKKAPPTETVLALARREAEKAKLPLEDFLQIWCARGSQGLQADWLKPHELAGRNAIGRRVPQAENFADKDYGNGIRRL